MIAMISKHFYPYFFFSYSLFLAFLCKLPTLNFVFIVFNSCFRFSTPLTHLIPSMRKHLGVLQGSNTFSSTKQKGKFTNTN